MRWPLRSRRKQEQARIQATLDYWERAHKWAAERDPMEPLNIDAIIQGAYEAGDRAALTGRSVS